MADDLKIEIDVSAAVKSLAEFRSNIDQVKNSLESLQGNKNFASFAKSLSALKPIDAATLLSFHDLADAAQRLSNVGSIKTFASEMRSLNRLDAGKLSTQMAALSGAMSQLRVPAGFSQEISTLAAALSALTNVRGFTTFARNLQQIQPINPATIQSFQQLTQAANGLSGANSIRGFVNEMRSLVRLDVAKLSQQMIALSAAMRNLQVPPNFSGMVGQLTALSQAATGAAQGLNMLAQQKNQAASAAQSFGGSLGSVNSLLAAFGVALGATGIATFLKSAYEINTIFNSFNSTMTAVLGPLGDIGGQMEFVRGTAARTATDILSATDAYRKFFTAAQLAGTATADIQKTFESFSIAGRVMKLSAADMKLVFLALEQMFNKGKVQSEELRRQLGERIPGAVNLMAKALGKTTAELDKMMENGEVSSSAVVKLGEEIRKSFGPGLADALKTPQAAFTLFKNSLTELSNSFGKGFFEGIGPAVSRLAETLGSSGMDDFATKLGNVTGKIAGAFVDAINIAVKAVDGLRGGIAALNTAWEFFMGKTGLLAEPLRALGKVFNETAAGAAVLSGALTALAASAGVRAIGTIAGWGSSLMALGSSSTVAATGVRALSAGLGGWATLAVGAAAATYAYATATEKVAESTQKAKAAIEEQKRATAQALAIEQTYEQAQKRVEDGLTKLANTAKQFNLQNVNMSTGISDASNAFQRAGINTDKWSASIKTTLGILGITGDEAKKLTDELLQGAASQSQLNKARKAETQDISRVIGYAEKRIQQLDRELTLKARLALSYQDKGASEQALKEIESLERVKQKLKEVAQTSKEVAGVKGSGAVMFANHNGYSIKVLDAVKEKLKEVGKEQDKLLEKARESPTGFSDLVKDDLKKKGAIPQDDPIKEQSPEAVAARLKIAEANNAIENSLSTLNKAINDNKQAFSELSVPIAQTAQSQSAINVQAAAITATFQKQGGSTEAYAAALRAVGLSSDEVRQKLESQKLTLDETKFTTKNAGEAMELLRLTQSRYGDLLKQHGTSIQISNEQLKSTVGAANTATEGVTKLTDAQQKLYDKVSRPFPTPNTKTVEDANKKVEESAEDAKKRLEEANKIDLGNVTQAIVGAAKGLESMKTNADAAKTPTEAIAKAFGETVSNSPVSTLESTATALKSVADRALEAAAAMREYQAASSGSGGGGGGSSDGNPSGAYREGGMVGSPMQTQNVPMTVFANAPKLAAGIENTNQILSGMSNGGIPSILHPGEAVVPLSGGRSIPVEFQGMTSAGTGGSTTIINNTTLSAIDLQALQANTKALNKSTGTMGDYQLPKPPDTSHWDGGEMNQYTAREFERYHNELAKLTEKMMHDKWRQTGVDYAGPQTFEFTQTTGSGGGSAGSGTSSGGGSTKSGTYNINLTVNISAKDADSFVKSEDQLVRELSVKLNKAIRRFG